MRTIAVVPVSWMLVVAALALWALPCQADGPFSYYPLTPCRLADTRKPNGPSGGPILQTGQDRAFPVQGLCGVGERDSGATDRGRGPDPLREWNHAAAGVELALPRRRVRSRQWIYRCAGDLKHGPRSIRIRR